MSNFTKNSYIHHFVSQVQDIPAENGINKLIKYLTIIGVEYMIESKQDVFTYFDIKQHAKSSQKQWVWQMRLQLQSLLNKPSQELKVQNFNQHSGNVCLPEATQKPLTMKNKVINNLELSQSSQCQPLIISPTSMGPSSSRYCEFLSSQSINPVEIDSSLKTNSKVANKLIPSTNSQQSLIQQSTKNSQTHHHSVISTNYKSFTGNKSFDNFGRIACQRYSKSPEQNKSKILPLQLPCYLRNVESKIADQVRKDRSLSNSKNNNSSISLTARNESIQNNQTPTEIDSLKTGHFRVKSNLSEQHSVKDNLSIMNMKQQKQAQQKNIQTQDNSFGTFFKVEKQNNINSHPQTAHRELKTCNPSPKSCNINPKICRKNKVNCFQLQDLLPQQKANQILSCKLSSSQLQEQNQNQQIPQHHIYKPTNSSYNLRKQLFNSQNQSQYQSNDNNSREQEDQFNTQIPNFNGNQPLQQSILFNSSTQPIPYVLQEEDSKRLLRSQIDRKIQIKASQITLENNSQCIRKKNLMNILSPPQQGADISFNAENNSLQIFQATKPHFVE